MFHKFPKDNDTKNKWIHCCKREDQLNSDNARICSLHFASDAYEKNLMYECLGQPVPRNQIRLKKGAIPTLHMPGKEHSYELKGK